MIHSVAGLLRDGKLMRQRQFCDPHPSACAASPAKCRWRISRVLFLDELPEFHGIR